MSFSKPAYPATLRLATEVPAGDQAVTVAVAGSGAKSLVVVLSPADVGLQAPTFAASDSDAAGDLSWGTAPGVFVHPLLTAASPVTVTFAVGTEDAWSVYYCSEMFPLPDVPVQFVVDEPAAGNDWALDITGPLRPLCVHAQLTCDDTAANREPSLLMENLATGALWQVPLLGAALTAGGGMDISAFPGAALVNNANSIASAPMPDVLVVPSARLESFTANMQAADQWSQISVLATFR